MGFIYCLIFRFRLLRTASRCLMWLLHSETNTTASRTPRLLLLVTFRCSSQNTTVPKSASCIRDRSPGFSGVASSRMRITSIPSQSQLSIYMSRLAPIDIGEKEPKGGACVIRSNSACVNALSSSCFEWPQIHTSRRG